MKKMDSNFIKFQCELPKFGTHVCILIAYYWAKLGYKGLAQAMIVLIASAGYFFDSPCR